MSTQKRRVPPGGNWGGLNKRPDPQYTTPNAAQIKGLMFGRWLDFYASSYPNASHLLSRPGQHGPCPLCGGTDRARFFPDVAETGGFHCNNCGTWADGLATVMLFEGCQFPESLRILAAWLGLDGAAPVLPRKALNVIVKPKPTPVLDTKALEALERVWGESIPAADEEAEPMRRYLDRRGVLLDPIPEVLRFHRGLDYWHPTKEGYHVKLGTFPAMLALMVNPQGQGVAIHRTFLDADGFKANPIYNGWPCEPRKMMRAPVRGASKGGAVRLFEAGPVLAAGEGIETMAAYHRLTGIPVWSALTAGSLENLEFPECVREVWIAADHDRNGRGQKAAQTLARRLEREGRRAYIHLPKEPGDWNDTLLKAARNDA